METFKLGSLKKYSQNLFKTCPVKSSKETFESGGPFKNTNLLFKIRSVTVSVACCNQLQHVYRH